jgi:hypothetical protein
MLAMLDPPLTTCVLDPGGVIGGSWYGGVGDIDSPIGRVGLKGVEPFPPFDGGGGVGKSESLRFDVDPSTSGLWDKVRGDLKERTNTSMTNPKALRLAARIYLDIARNDSAALVRSLTRVRLEDGGYQP